MTRRVILLLGSVVCIALAGPAAAAASEAAPWWWVGSEVTPTNLPPGHEGEIVVVASNLGAGAVNGGNGEPVTITDTLPAGLTATEITGQVKHRVATNCALSTLQCTFTGVLYPYEHLSVTIRVKVDEPAGTVTTLPNLMSVQGGGAAHVATRTDDLRISAAGTPFGVQEQGYELAPYNQNGTPASAGGSHPFQLTSTFVMNQVGVGSDREPVALPRNLSFKLPLGLIGNPQATEQCPMSDFTAHTPVSEINQCPPNTVVGVASVTIDEPENAGVITLPLPLFNLVPAEGEPARFGFEALGLVPVVIDTAVDPSDDYDIVARVTNASQLAGLLSSQVTIWGVPGDPLHNQARGWECIAGGGHHERGEVSTPCPTSTTLPQTPLLTLPTSCPTQPASEPSRSSAQAESWTESGHAIESEYVWSGPLEEPLGFSDCEVLPFAPAIETSPQQTKGQPVHSGASPSGLSVDVQVPQDATTEPSPEGRGEADVRDATVTLPKGVMVNPSAANGLEGCPETQTSEYEGVGFERFAKVLGDEREPAAETQVFSPTFRFAEEDGRKPSCPDGSKVGVVRIRTPLLKKEVEGGLYLAEPAPNGEEGRNPFDSLIAFYLVAQDKEAGILVKLAGEGKLDPVTGQVSTSFRDTPQLPFEELHVELFGGQRASISTPAFCGDYRTEGSFTPWSMPFGGPATSVLSPDGEFAISENCASGATLGFSPAFDAHSQSTQAGATTSFTLQLERSDGQQALTGLSMHLPPGVSALLSRLTPCAEPAGGQPWACGPESLIGHSSASSGVGSEPVTLGGTVYLTTGYDGAPFGILDETEAKAGPFDLGEVYVRSKIEVNPNTAAVTITTDPGPHADGLPTMLKGVPVDLRQLTVSVDRPEFELNPTNCSPARIEGTLQGAEGASPTVSSPFQVGGCQSLPFHPTFKASVTGHASKAEGTTLTVLVTSPGLGQANIQKVDLQLPKQLSSRLPTLQKACKDTVFEANPATCDPESIIGTATIHTPILKNPLTGPAYLVSHGNAAFPDVEFLLQGEDDLKLVLDGQTQIKNQITYSKFESAPDAPFTTFETTLPAGPHGVLTANVAESKHYDLCGENLQMPIKITGQNGAVIEQNTKITIQGCAAVKAAKVKKLTRAQLLAKALAACRHKDKHTRHKRALCEARARRVYAAKHKRAPNPGRRKASPKHRG